MFTTHNPKRKRGALMSSLTLRVVIFNDELHNSLQMSNFPPTTAELFETFEDLEEWDERYDFIIDLGRELPPLPADLQTEDNIVKGCMSTVWVVTDVEGEGDAEKLNIQADSDSIIVKGLIVLLLAFYNNMSPQEVATADVESYLGKLGLNQHLSPQRRNGLFSMVKRLRTLEA